MTINPKPSNKPEAIDNETLELLGKEFDLTSDALQLFKEVAQTMLRREKDCDSVILENGKGGFVAASFLKGKFDHGESIPSTDSEIPNMNRTFNAAVNAGKNSGIEVMGAEKPLGPRAIVLPMCAP